MWVTLFLYVVLAVCATIVFAACFADGSAAAAAKTTQEGLRVRRHNGDSGTTDMEGLKMGKQFGKIGKKLGSATKNITKTVSGAVTGKKDDNNDDDAAGEIRGEGTIIRIPPQPDMQEVVRQISAQLQNLSKPQIMEIVKTARDVISEKNDEEQKLEDELNKL